MSEVNSSRRQFVQASLAIAAASALPGAASAQAFPAKPIRLICPWPAGVHQKLRFAPAKQSPSGHRCSTELTTSTGTYMI